MKPRIGFAYREVTRGFGEARRLESPTERWRGYGILLAAYAAIPLVASYMAMRSFKR